MKRNVEKLWGAPAVVAIKKLQRLVVPISRSISFNLSKVNLVLFFVFFVLLVFSFDKTISDIGWNAFLNKATKIASENIQVAEFVLNVLYSLAVVFAGLWTYYQFIKGRTFSPKMSIFVEMHGRGKNDKKNLIVARFKISNIGNIRIRPKSAEVHFFYGVIQDGTVVYHPLAEIANLFASYFSESERFYLEPKDEMTIDIPLVLKGYEVESASDARDDAVISINAEIADFHKRIWTENVILSLTGKDCD